MTAADDDEPLTLPTWAQPGFLRALELLELLVEGRKDEAALLLSLLDDEEMAAMAALLDAAADARAAWGAELTGRWVRAFKNARNPE